MYEIYDTDTKRVVASFQLDPYRYRIHAGGERVEAILNRLKDVKQMNRTSFEGEPAFPEDGKTSMEAYQDPTAQYRLHRIAGAVKSAGFGVVDVSKQVKAEDTDIGFDRLPDGWDASTVQEVWSKLGRSFTSCKTKMVTEEGWSEGKANRFCAALKDEALGREDWREGGAEADAPDIRDLTDDQFQELIEPLEPDIPGQGDDR